MVKDFEVYRFLIFFTLFGGGVYLLYKSDNEVACEWQKQFSELQLNGVVINKYLDSTSHSVPTIVLNTKSSDGDSCIFFFGERSNAFNSIQIGDTLEKSKNSNDIKVKYYGEKVYKVSFGCNEK